MGIPAEDSLSEKEGELAALPETTNAEPEGGFGDYLVISATMIRGENHANMTPENFQICRSLGLDSEWNFTRWLNCSGHNDASDDNHLRKVHHDVQQIRRWSTILKSI
jgi:hypothetical protein